MVGGSLAGLMTALTLSRSGLRVTVLERQGPTPGIGGMLGVQDGLLERLTGRRHGPGEQSPTSLPGGVHSWGSIHDNLRRTVELDPDVDLRHDVRVRRVDQDEHAAWVTTDDGEEFVADLVIGADGHRSLVRRAVAPHRPDAEFAGYVIWLATIGERDLPAHVQGHPGLDDGAFVIDDRDVLFGGLVPATRSDAARDRQIGWAWYDATHNDFLRQNGHVRDDVVHHSVKAHELPDAIAQDLQAMVSHRFSAPWREVLLISLAQRVVTGVPVAEYLPEQLSRGRLAIVGNAAHVPTPMTGNGFAESLADAEAVAAAVAGGVQGAAAATALGVYERDRLWRAQDNVRSGRRFSRSFARGAT